AHVLFEFVQVSHSRFPFAFSTNRLHPKSPTHTHRPLSNRAEMAVLPQLPHLPRSDCRAPHRFRPTRPFRLPAAAVRLSILPATAARPAAAGLLRRSDG